MQRTTVLLPEDLKERALRRARETEQTLSDLLREGLRRLLGDEPSRVRREDPLFATDWTTDFGEADAVADSSADPGPHDAADHHDEYLYGSV